MAEILEPFAFDAVYGSFRAGTDRHERQAGGRCIGRALHRARQRDIAARRQINRTPSDTA